MRPPATGAVADPPQLTPSSGRKPSSPSWNLRCLTDVNALYTGCVFLPCPNTGSGQDRIVHSPREGDQGMRHGLTFDSGSLSPVADWQYPAGI